MSNKPRKTTLRPLQPDIHRTGRWTYLGKNLANIELKKLAAKGVCEEDWMPDNRLKHPRFRKSWRKSTVKQATMSEEAFESLFSKFQAEYDALTEPRPNMFDWFANTHPEIMLKGLLRNVLMAGRTSDTDKASRTILEFGKQKPKQVIETGDSNEKFESFSPMELLCMALENCGIDPNKFKEFLESNPTITVQ